MQIKISKRKLESYKRAELLARELRFQLTRPYGQSDMESVSNYLIRWMDKTGKIKFERP